MNVTFGLIEFQVAPRVLGGTLHRTIHRRYLLRCNPCPVGKCFSLSPPLLPLPLIIPVSLMLARDSAESFSVTIDGLTHGLTKGHCNL